MVRPTKAADVRRVRKAGVRFTDDEYAAVMARAGASGVILSEFLRVCALNRPLPRAAATQAASPTSFAVADQLRRVGINLNQIARMSHMGVEHQAELLDLLGEIREILAGIHGPAAGRRAG